VSSLLECDFGREQVALPDRAGGASGCRALSHRREGRRERDYLALRSMAGRRPKTAANAIANPVAATVRPTYFESMPLISAATASRLRVR
jgi:hypothetical protein